MKTLLTSAVLLTLAIPAQAALYRCVSPTGKTSFQDHACASTQTAAPVQAPETTPAAPPVRAPDNFESERKRAAALSGLPEKPVAPPAPPPPPQKSAAEIAAEKAAAAKAARAKAAEEAENRKRHAAEAARQERARIDPTGYGKHVAVNEKGVPHESVTTHELQLQADGNYFDPVFKRVIVVDKTPAVHAGGITVYNTSPVPLPPLPNP